MAGFFILQALWIFLPAYNANMAPVFAMKLFPNWNARIDGGRNHRDGRALLGAGKTWRGLIAGTLVASLTAYLQSFIRNTDVAFSDFHYTEVGWWAPLVLGAFYGFGAIVGDAVKSYFKRRTGREGGAPWVPFDQLDFVVGGLLFVLLAAVLVKLVEPAAPNWFWDEFGGAGWPKLLTLLLATPLLHFLVNIIGYKLKLKKVPW
jgi:CDP-2,3-bis-(O-geranylgeranyl)-sn-glycerol synthase